jgi:cytochrome c oxidase subunit 3
VTAVESGGEHTSRWPLVTAVGAPALYVGAGLTLVGLDLVPVVLPALLVGGALGVGGGLACRFVDAFLVDYWDGRDDIYTGGMVLFLVSDVATFLAGFVYYGFIPVGAWPPTSRHYWARSSSSTPSFWWRRA